MSAHVANVELIARNLLRDVLVAEAPEHTPLLAPDLEERSVVRGIVTAAMLSVPFWSLLGFGAYLFL